MKNLFALLFAFLFVILSQSCGGDDNEPPPVNNDVLIINEGNFQSGDGSISLFNPVENEVTLNAYEAANGDPVGATIQKVVEHNRMLYMVTNFPDRLEKINPETLVREGELSTGFNNPFAFAAVGDKGYVTNWGNLNFETFLYEDSYISVIDLNTMTELRKIESSVQPQDAVVVNGTLYVSDWSSNTVSVYNTETDEEITNINMPFGPDRMVVDKDENIWVLCSTGRMVKITTADNQTNTIIQGIAASGFNEKMVINEDGDKLYWLAASGFNPSTSAIWEMSITSTQAPESPIIEGENFYGIGVSNDNILYVADAAAFQSTGTIIRYQVDGIEIDNFAAGRGPNGFLFFK